MAPPPRTTAALVLALAAFGSSACDVERWLLPLRGDVPAQVEVAQEKPVQAARPVRADADLDQPLRPPAPPPSTRSSFNKISSSSSTTAKKPAASAGRSAPREIQPGSGACESARRDLARMEAQIASLEREVERLEDGAHDIRQSDYWRERQETRMEAAERELEAAEEALGDYLDSQRRQGVPAGCLR